LFLGIGVKRVCIGFDTGGLYLLRWPGRHWEWVVGLVPLGGYTKFVESEDEIARTNAKSAALPTDLVTESRSLVPPLISFQAASPTARIAILLAGPLSQFVLGMICLAIPVTMAAKQLKLTSPNASTIRPCAVSGLAESDRRATIEGQLHLSWDIGSNVFRKIALFRDLEGWGGYLGCLLTCGAAAIRSWSAWFSCLGTVILTLGTMNLLPIPTHNGGQIVITLVEVIRGRKMPERLQELLTWFGLILVLIWLGRIIVADASWLSSVVWLA
jgi:membrane-associated protease RseP (regulator of RpoE activity)